MTSMIAVIVLRYEDDAIAIAAIARILYGRWADRCTLRR